MLNIVVRQTEIKKNISCEFRYSPTFEMSIEKQGVVPF